jgi:hypothetical protein
MRVLGHTVWQFAGIRTRQSRSLLPDAAYREVVAVIEQQTTTFLRAELAAALADLQVSFMRKLAARLRAAATPDAQWLPVEASADQLEASVRQIRCTLRRGQPTG